MYMSEICISTYQTCFLIPLDSDQTSKPFSITSSRSSTAGRGPEGQGQSSHQSQQSVVIEGLDSGTVVGIAFAAFAIGILLTGALWFIHTHTSKAWNLLKTNCVYIFLVTVFLYFSPTSRLLSTWYIQYQQTCIQNNISAILVVPLIVEYREDWRLFRVPYCSFTNKNVGFFLNSEYLYCCCLIFFLWLIVFAKQFFFSVLSSNSFWLFANCMLQVPQKGGCLAWEQSAEMSLPTLHHLFQPETEKLYLQIWPQPQSVKKLKGKNSGNVKGKKTPKPFAANLPSL